MKTKQKIYGIMTGGELWGITFVSKELAVEYFKLSYPNLERKYKNKTGWKADCYESVEEGEYFSFCIEELTLYNKLPNK